MGTAMALLSPPFSSGRGLFSFLPSTRGLSLSPPSLVRLSISAATPSTWRPSLERPQALLSPSFSASLEKVKNPEVKAFIKVCIARERPYVVDLLNHPFFNDLDDEPAVTVDRSHEPSAEDLSTLHL